MKFKITDSFLCPDVADVLYSKCLTQYSLNQYKSYNFYNSKTDGKNFINLLKNLSSNFVKLININSHVFANSFLPHSKNIGMHQDKKYQTYNQLMLCKEGHNGGDILFPDGEWSIGQWPVNKPSQFMGCAASLKHNRLVSSDANQLRMMDFIFTSNGPVIYINILS